MKKLLFYLIVSIMVIGVVNTASAQDFKYKVNLKKEYKAKLKSFKKNGWEIAQSSLTLETALAKHYDKLFNQENKYELIGTAVNVKTYGLGSDGAYKNAITSYAQKVSASILGKMSAMGALEQVSGSQKDLILSAYSLEIEKMVIRDIEPSFTVVKKMKNGFMDYETYYIVDESKAKNTREQAMKNVLAQVDTEVELTQDILNVIRQKPE